MNAHWFKKNRLIFDCLSQKWNWTVGAWQTFYNKNVQVVFILKPIVCGSWLNHFFLLYFSNFFVWVCLNWKCKSKWNAIILTSAILFNEGAAINTTYGVNSEVRRIFRAWGSTSKIAIFPSLWMRRMVSNLVPYIASSCVPITKKNIKQLQIKHRQLRLTKSKPIGNGQFSSVYLKCHVQFFPVKQKCTQIHNKVRTIFQIFVGRNVSHHFVMWHEIVATSVFFLLAWSTSCVYHVDK